MDNQDDLRERLNEFTADVVRLIEDFPKSRSGNHLAERVLDSVTQPAARLARQEHRSHEIGDDVVEELNETLFYLRLAHQVDLLRHKDFLEDVIREGEALVEIVQQ